MKRTALRVLIVAFWLTMGAWLVRYEAFPEYFGASLPGYRALSSRDELISDSWMKIRLKGQDIGYGYTGIETAVSDADSYCTLNTRVHLRVSFMGTPQDAHAIGSAVLDSAYRLQSFSASLSFKDLLASAQGVRREDRTFDVEIQTPLGAQTSRLDIPDDIVLYSPLSDMAMRRLRPGQRLSLQTLDPLSLKKSRIDIEALRRETLALGTNRYEAVVLAVRHQGIETRTWIDSQGHLLRQEAPMGWSLEKCSREEALATVRQAGAGADILTILSSPLLPINPPPAGETHDRN